MRSVEDGMKQLRKEMENKWETGSSFTAASGSTQNLDVKPCDGEGLGSAWHTSYQSHAQGLGAAIG